MRLVLATWDGGRPRKANAGDIIIPPPIPTKDPKIPATIPIIINRSELSNNWHTATH
jgi:hypothetical protein